MSIRTKREGSAGIVIIDRPEAKNALDRTHADALAEAITTLAADKAVRGIVLTGAGDTFASGGDLKAFAEILDDPKGGEQVLSFYEPLSEALRCDVPVIAAVQGACLGGGAELILLCDLVIIEAQAYISFRHARMGLTPAWGAVGRLLERTGPHFVADILFSAEQLSAERALELGLVNAIAEQAAAVSYALDRIAKYAQSDRTSVAALKRVLAAVRQRRLEEDLAIEREHFLERWGSPEHRAAMTTFAKSRK